MLFGALAVSLVSAFDAAHASRSCVAVAGGPPNELFQRASLKPADAKELEVKLTYIGHSTFQIESPDGIRIATDYNDYVRPAEIPDIVTMNRAHDTHYTNFPDPRIAQVLRGWNPDGGRARHDVTLSDVRVRNVATNIRNWDGGGTAQYGNSIFVFELADLCIAHLGHLHHTLNQDQLAELGQMDVVLVPVDGSYTLDLDGMVEVLKAIRAPLMISHALLLSLYARPLPGPRDVRLRGSGKPGEHHHSLARHAAEKAGSARAAGPVIQKERFSIVVYPRHYAVVICCRETTCK